MTRLSRLTFILSLAIAPGSALAGPSEQDILNQIGSCLVENAPDNWQTFIVKVDDSKRSPDGKKLIEFEHLVIVGSPDAVPVNLRPCLPTFVPGKIEQLRETLPAIDRGWVKAVLTVQRSGSFNLKYTQPDGT